MILNSFVVGRIQANCYVVGDEESRDVLMIDPGDDAARLVEQLARLDLRPVAVLVTHHHLDHSGQAHELLEAYPGARFYMHRLDYPQIAAAAGSASAWYGHEVTAPREPDRLLEHGDSFAVGSHRFTVLHCPGHTPGSLCVYSDEQEGTVFTGDVLFAGSVGRSDFPGGDHDQLIHSIGEHLTTLPDSTTILPGHGPASTVVVEREQNPFLGGRGRLDA